MDTVCWGRLWPTTSGLLSTRPWLHSGRHLNKDDKAAVVGCPKCGREFRLRKYGSLRMVLLTIQAGSLDQRNIIKCGHIRVARVNIGPHTFTPWIPPGTLFVIIYWTMGQIHTSLSTQHPQGMRLLMTTDTVQWVLFSGGRHGCLPCSLLVLLLFYTVLSILNTNNSCYTLAR